MIYICDEKIDLTTIGFVIDGSGSEITTREKSHIIVPFSCTIIDKY